MLYTQDGNLRPEDQTLRRIARQIVRAALRKMDAETDASFHPVCIALVVFLSGKELI